MELWRLNLESADKTGEDDFLSKDFHTQKFSAGISLSEITNFKIHLSKSTKNLLPVLNYLPNYC